MDHDRYPAFKINTDLDPVFKMSIDPDPGVYIFIRIKEELNV